MRCEMLKMRCSCRIRTTTRICVLYIDHQGSRSFKAVVPLNGTPLCRHWTNIYPSLINIWLVVLVRHDKTFGCILPRSVCRNSDNIHWTFGMCQALFWQYWLLLSTQLPIQYLCFSAEQLEIRSWQGLCPGRLSKQERGYYLGIQINIQTQSL